MNVLRKYAGPLVLMAMTVAFKLIGLPPAFAWVGAGLAMLLAVVEAGI